MQQTPSNFGMAKEAIFSDTKAETQTSEISGAEPVQPPANLSGSETLDRNSKLDLKAEVNSYFSMLYTGSISLMQMLELMKRLSTFEQGTQQFELFTAMLHSFFTECRYLPKYPLQELIITAELFGNLIAMDVLVSHGNSLVMALRCIIEALKRGTEVEKLFTFGVVALEQFLDKFACYPQFLKALLQISSFRQHFPGYTQYAAKVQAALPEKYQDSFYLNPKLLAGVPLPNVPRPNHAISRRDSPSASDMPSESNISNMSSQDFNQPESSDKNSTSTQPTTECTPAQQQFPPQVTPLSLQGLSLAPIEILLNDPDIVDDVKKPSKAIVDQIVACFNCICESNVQAKADSIRSLLEPEYIAWISFYIVKSRAAKEPNLHSIIIDFVDALKLPKLWDSVLNMTYECVNVMLKYVDQAKDSLSYRTVLNNLGLWLGCITLARNRPLKLKNVDLKMLLYEAFEHDRLVAVLPLVCKIMLAIKDSKNFRPPNPWTTAILSILGEIHQMPQMKTNLIFEVELLFKSLNMFVESYYWKTAFLQKKIQNVTVDNSKRLGTESNLATPEHHVESTASHALQGATQPSTFNSSLNGSFRIGLPSSVSGKTTPSVIGEPLKSQSQGFSTSHFSDSNFKEKRVPPAPLDPLPYTSMETNQYSETNSKMTEPPISDASLVMAFAPPGITQKSQVKGISASLSKVAPVRSVNPFRNSENFDNAGLTAGSLPASSAATARSSGGETSVVLERLLDNLASSVVISPSIALFQIQPNLRPKVPLAVDMAIRKIIPAVVERSVVISCIATRELVSKDFMVESEEFLVKRAAHLMAASLAGSLALATCREPLRVSLTQHLTQLLQPVNKKDCSDNVLIEQVVQIISADNLELGCTLIEQAVVEKALRDIGKTMAPGIAARKKARENGTIFVDKAYLPPSFRMSYSGADALRSFHYSHQQLQIYKDFMNIGPLRKMQALASLTSSRETTGTPTAANRNTLQPTATHAMKSSATGRGLHTASTNVMNEGVKPVGTYLQERDRVLRVTGNHSNLIQSSDSMFHVLQGQSTTPTAPNRSDVSSSTATGTATSIATPQMSDLPLQPILGKLDSRVSQLMEAVRDISNHLPVVPHQSVDSPKIQPIHTSMTEPGEVSETQSNESSSSDPLEPMASAPPSCYPAIVIRPVPPTYCASLDVLASLPSNHDIFGIIRSIPAVAFMCQRVHDAVSHVGHILIKVARDASQYEATNPAFSFVPSFMAAGIYREVALCTLQLLSRKSQALMNQIFEWLMATYIIQDSWTLDDTLLISGLFRYKLVDFSEMDRILSEKIASGSLSTIVFSLSLLKELIDNQITLPTDFPFSFKAIRQISSAAITRLMDIKQNSPTDQSTMWQTFIEKYAEPINPDSLEPLDTTVVKTLTELIDFYVNEEELNIYIRRIPPPTISPNQQTLVGKVFDEWMKLYFFQGDEKVQQRWACFLQNVSHQGLLRMDANTDIFFCGCIKRAIELVERSQSNENGAGSGSENAEGVCANQEGQTPETLVTEEKTESEETFIKPGLSAQSDVEDKKSDDEKIETQIDTVEPISNPAETQTPSDLTETTTPCETVSAEPVHEKSSLSAASDPVSDHELTPLDSKVPSEVPDMKTSDGNSKFVDLSPIDAYAKMIIAMMKLVDPNQISAVVILQRNLGVLCRMIEDQSRNRPDQFNQRLYFSIFLSLLKAVNMSVSVSDSNNLDCYLTFANHLLLLSPIRVPAFAFCWLELISHRTFMPRLLNHLKSWNIFHKLLVEHFRFMYPFLANASLPASIRKLYTGTLRVFLTLLHDFPEMLCDYYFSFCDVLPLNCVQLRNLILSAFPRNIKLPDPFLPSLKIDLLSEMKIVPRVISDYSITLLHRNMKSTIDYYWMSRDKSALYEMKAKLMLTESAAKRTGTKYHIQLLNAVVFYTGVSLPGRALALLQNAGASAVDGGPTLELIQFLSKELDMEGRFLLISSIANHLRYPNVHTHYFSCLLLWLFAESEDEVKKEQVTLVLLERLIVHRPHPWGLLITFIELIKNPRFQFWSCSFVHAAPEVEKLFLSVAQVCLGSSSLGNANVSQVKPE